MDKQKATAIIVGAGSGTRMGMDKVFLELLRRPTLAWAVEPFEKSELIDRIVIVLAKSNICLGNELMSKEKWTKVMGICEGGARRQDSVRNGLECAGSDTSIVMIHDAARPCITSDILRGGLTAVQETGAADPVVRLVDTIVRTNKNSELVEVVPRDDLRAVQTPQTFDYRLIMAAHKNSEDATDDLTMVQRIGGRVLLYEGSPSNIKITTAKDILLAEQFLRLMQKVPP
jgi:2-C-methyl-D-erythritol 4-phosphate cytidylyltransferase